VTDLCANDALTLAGMLRRREVSAREVTAAHIERIEALDGSVNAVVTRSFDRARVRAAEPASSAETAAEAAAAAAPATIRAPSSGSFRCARRRRARRSVAG